MNGNLLRIPNSELKIILKNSKLLEDITKSNILEDKILINIGQSWEAIYYILTGRILAEWDDEPQPLSWIMFNLEQFVDEEQDFGYGPANYSTSEQVKQISKKLKPITGPDIKKAYRSNEMLELQIYPAGFWDDKEETKTLLIENFEKLKQLYADAAEKNEAVIAYLN